MERLEWLTDVMTTASSGAEQRRALRVSPRRYVEITVNPTRQERSYLDLMLHKNGSEQWLFPLWFDAAKLSSAAEAGDTRVEFDTTYREHGMGQYALLMKDAFTWEVISVDGSDDDGLDLADPLEADWPKGTRVFPLRLARLPIETTLSALTSRVGQTVLLFQIVESNDYPSVTPDDLLFETIPVLSTAPNRSQSIDLTHMRYAAERDNSVGIPYRADPLGRAFQVQSHNWMLKGRQAQSEFRSLLYWLRGRQRSLWLPSFNDDVIVTRDAAMAAFSLDVENIGMAYAGGVLPGRDVLMVGGKGARITALGAAPSEDEERLVIGAGLSGAVNADTTGSFMSIARLNQDSIELLHHTDIDGVMEASATFQTFSNTRNPAGSIYLPIPAAVKTSGPCGNFDGIYLEVLLEILPVTGIPSGKRYFPKKPSGWVGTTLTGNRALGSPGLKSTNGVLYEELPIPPGAEIGSGVNSWAGGKCSYFIDVPVDTLFELRYQFSWSGLWENSNGETNMARVRYRRWPEEEWSTAEPNAGSYSLAGPDGWFAIEGLWPDDWTFTF